LIKKYAIKFLIIFSVALLFSGYLFSGAFAEQQLPGVVVSVEADPFYFSEGGFGIGILNFFERPLDPYLVSGKTTAESSPEEILSAFYESQKQDSAAIVDDKDRPLTFTVSFFGGEFKERHSFSTFSKFEPLKVQNNPRIPYYYDLVREGFTLESLPSKDKEWFYKSVISGYINPGKAPEPFDADIEITTGDGGILQTWQYTNCDLLEYTPFLDENLTKLKFIGGFVSEIREKSVFECVGFSLDFELKPSQTENSEIIRPIDFIPSNNDRATSFQIQFSGGGLESTQTFNTFPKFTPVTEAKIPILVSGNPIGEKPQFILESHPSKDKEEYYKFLSTYINIGKAPEPFDATINILTGDGAILQKWYYTECDATNYVTFFFNNLMFYKFKESTGSEIRDKTYFSCSGLTFDSDFADENKIELAYHKATDENRAQIFVAHFEGPDITPAKSITTFTKFSSITNDELSILLPSAPFTETPKFYFESIPNTENEWFYQLIAKYVNPGKIPEPFDVDVEVLVGDGTTLQTLQYTDCEIIHYKSFLDNILLIGKFTAQYETEMHDQTIFECVGFSLDGNSYSPETLPEKTLGYADFVPEEQNRAQRFVLTISGGEIKEDHTYHTFTKFEPLLEEKSSKTPATHQINSVGFTLESLPSKDKENYYHFFSRYVNPGKAPEPFDAKIELVTSGGKIIQSWNYVDCDLENYDSFLADNLLEYTFNGKKAVSEIRNKSLFMCVGFSMDFDSHDSNYSLDQKVIPDVNDRAMAYVFHTSGGELEKTRTTELVQEFNTLENQDFLVESLPNEFETERYEHISDYISPGAIPELFDVRADLITGDGTILLSGKFSKCEVTSYAVYLNDNIVNIKFTPSLKFEIRDNQILHCAGANPLVMPQKDSFFDQGGNLKKISPLVQKKIGVESDNIQCNDGFELMIRPPKNVGICVMDSNVSQFEDRGWEHVTSQIQWDTSGFVKSLIPTDEQRALSFVVHFQGTDIAPPKTINTFSNFVPIIDDDSPVLTIGNTLDEGKKQFYLESLPSKDKEWLYQLFSKYVNPGKIPEPFDVDVDVLTGDGRVLQTWEYNDCERTDYQLFLDDGLLIYKFHEKWQSEMKDRSFLACNGLSLNVLDLK
jgi:hypothetical protein